MNRGHNLWVSWKRRFFFLKSKDDGYIEKICEEHDWKRSDYFDYLPILILEHGSIIYCYQVNIDNFDPRRDAHRTHENGCSSNKNIMERRVQSNIFGTRFYLPQLLLIPSQWINIGGFNRTRKWSKKRSFPF
jgi:hypothetical protein